MQAEAGYGGRRNQKNDMTGHSHSRINRTQKLYRFAGKKETRVGRKPVIASSALQAYRGTNPIAREMKEMEHVKPLTFTNAADGKAMTEQQLKQLTSRHEETLKEALEKQATEFKDQIEKLKEELSKKKDK